MKGQKIHLQELRSVLGQLQTTMHHAQEELEETGPKVLHALMVVSGKIDAKKLLAAAKAPGLVWHQVFITHT